MKSAHDSIWIFKGVNRYPGFPSGAFKQIETAEIWIAENRLTGVLTEYPLDIGIYDWVQKEDLFEPDDENVEITPNYIGNFSSAYQKHFHYTDGARDN